MCLQGRVEAKPRPKRATGRECSGLGGVYKEGAAVPELDGQYAARNRKPGICASSATIFFFYTRKIGGEYVTLRCCLINI